MTKKKKIDPNFIKIGFLRSFLESKMGVIISNFLAQGFLEMEKEERVFKIFMEFVFSIIILIGFLFFGVHVSVEIVLLSMVMGHFFNWTLNGQIFTLGRYVGFTKNKNNKFVDYSKSLGKRLSRVEGVSGVACFGSLSREKTSYTSDLDVRVIVENSFKSKFMGCFFVFVERLRALFTRFPLDIYTVSIKSELKGICKSETPIILFDREGYFEKVFGNKIMFDEKY